MSTVEFDFGGRHVLVTGGTSGIGAAIAAAFQRAGADVTITGTRPTSGDYDADLSPYRYRPLRLTDRGALDTLAGEFETLDVLVSNAGQTLPGGRNEWEPDVFEDAVAINLSGAFRLAVACQERLMASSLPGGGNIVHLASMSSFFAVPMVPGYGAAKAGIVQLTKNLAVAWAAEGVRVNAVAPGLVESNMTSVMKGIEALEGPQLARTPLGRWGQPAEIAPAVLFLASSAAGFVTGATLCVDGGYSAG